MADTTNTENALTTQREGDIVEFNQSTGEMQVISPATRAEIDMQISTAKAYPRSFAQFKELAMSMATLDEETAGGCFYSMKRGDKKIEGPSIRLAEIVLNSWGNVRAESRVIETGARIVTAEGMCWDLERNIAVRVQTQRRITNSSGQRYNDDMVVMTGNAASSIALRNAIFRVVPVAMIKAVYSAARRVAAGSEATLGERRKAMLEHFKKLKVTEAKLLTWTGRASVDDMTTEDVFDLKGVATAIKDGETTVAAQFAVAPPADDSGKSRSEALAEKITGKPAAGGASKTRKKAEPAEDAKPAKKGQAKKDASTDAAEDAGEADDQDGGSDVEMEDDGGEKQDEPESKSGEVSEAAALISLAEKVADENGMDKVTDDLITAVEKGVKASKTTAKKLLGNAAGIRILARAVKKELGL